jgi:hypothetical protein
MVVLWDPVLSPSGVGRSMVVVVCRRACMLQYLFAVFRYGVYSNDKTWPRECAHLSGARAWWRGAQALQHWV